MGNTSEIEIPLAYTRLWKTADMIPWKNCKYKLENKTSLQVEDSERVERVHA